MRHLLLVFSLLVGAGAALADTPKRIVSVGGAITETVFALGEKDRLVAVDSTSLFPPEARQIPNVGYMRALSAEPILALDPDLILLHADAGPDSVIGQLEQSGVDIVRLPKATDIDSAGLVIEGVANALGRAEDGRDLAAGVTTSARSVEAIAARVADKPRVLFLLSIGRGAPLASGAGTAAMGLIEAAGGINAIDGFEGFKPLSPEAAVTANPDIILVTHRTLELMGGRDAILSRPEIAPTAAGREARLVAVDGLKMLGFGPRLPAALAELAKRFHPDIAGLGG